MSDSINNKPTRTVLRLLMGNYIRWVTSLNKAFEGDMLMGIVFAAIVQANVGWINDDEDLAVFWGALDSPPPDTLRRPVSARALALSLGLPRETVRRQAEKLVQRGLCVRDSRLRLTAPTSVLASPFIRELTIADYDSFTAMIAAMRRLDVLPEG